ncbi:MAG: TolC family protein [Gemmatimonadetes bacterium]|nr:TolC family protein [Gemmatimonadota bacterium]NNM04780.1 TolC family protein [Gemmatimonadota bacterium]
MKIRSAVFLAIGLALVLPIGISAQVEEEPYQMGRALPPLPSDGSLVELTLDEAIARALEMNLDIQAARLNPEIQNYSLFSARAAFAPTFSMTVGQNNSSQQSTSQLDGGIRTSTDRLTFNSSISKPVPWYGGRLSANFNNSRTETNNSFATLNPSFRSSFSLNYNQPLLSGFRVDNQRNALRTQEIQLEITDVQLQAQVENLTNQVRSAYWSLRSAIENIEIQRRALAQAQQLLAQNQIRVQLGTMSELQVVQAESQVANAEQSLLNAEVQWRNQELNFKRLLLGGADDPLLFQTLNPTSLPVMEEVTVDIQAAIERALVQRTDIRQQRQQKEISELNLEVTQDNVKPSLDLSASYSVSGVGGDQYQRDQLGGDPVLIGPGGYQDALQAIADRDTPTWNLSLNFSYPIGNQGAKANLERARLQMRQTELDLKSQELFIVTQVTDAGLNVTDTYLQWQAAQRSREVAERSAEIEQTRFTVGASTNYEVTEAQDNLRSARLSELRAIINYVNAIAEFERVQRVGG